MIIKMKTVNYSELRENLKENLDAVSENNDLLIVHRSKGKSVVVMSIDEYSSLEETLHLYKSKANRERLENAVENINDKSNLIQNSLIEE
jgi:antitoxin YefM